MNASTQTPVSQGTKPTDSADRVTQWLNRVRREWPVLLPVLLVCGIGQMTYFAPGSNRSYGYQAGIASFIGWRISQGDVLYVDVWENKGPLHYLINALAVSLNYRYGVYCFELLCLVLTAILMYRIARLFTGLLFSALASSLALGLLTRTLVGGNLVEEWSMPFQAGAILAAFALILKPQAPFRGRSFGLGLSLMAVLLMRPNILAFTGIATLTAMIYLVKTHGWGRLGRASAWAIAGATSLATPVIIYLAAHGAIKAGLSAAYLDVVHWTYTREQRFNNFMTLLGILRAGGVLVLLALFLLAVIVWLGVTMRRRHLDAATGPGPMGWVLLACVLGLSANMAANQVSGNADPNYMMTFVPLLVAPYAWLLERAHDLLPAHRAAVRSVVAVVVAGALLLTATADRAIPTWWRFTHEMTPQAVQAQEAASLIDQVTQPGDRIEVFGLAPTAYYNSQRASGSPRIYPPMKAFDQIYALAWRDKMTRDVIERPPELLLFSAPEVLEAWITIISPDLAKSFLELLDQHYEIVDNDYGFAAYRLLGG